MLNKVFLASLCIFIAPITIAKPIKPQAYADVPDDIIIFRQLKQYHKQQKHSDWQAKDLQHTWQLYFSTNDNYQYFSESPMPYFQIPITITFDKHTLNITQDCLSLISDYRLSAMQQYEVITENMTYHDKNCTLDKTIITQIFEKIGYIEIIPIRIYGKSEKILKIKGELLPNQPDVLFFRKIIAK